MTYQPENTLLKKVNKEQLLTRYRVHLSAKAEIEVQLEHVRQDLLIRILDLLRLERELGDEGELDWNEQAAQLRDGFRQLSNHIGQLVVEARGLGASAVHQPMLQLEHLFEQQPVAQPLREPLPQPVSLALAQPLPQPVAQPVPEAVAPVKQVAILAPDNVVSSPRRTSRPFVAKSPFSSGWSRKSRWFR